MTINSIFKDMLFAHGFGLDMKKMSKSRDEILLNITISEEMKKQNYFDE